MGLGARVAAIKEKLVFFPVYPSKKYSFGDCIGSLRVRKVPLSVRRKQNSQWNRAYLPSEFRN